MPQTPTGGHLFFLPFPTILDEWSAIRKLSRNGVRGDRSSGEGRQHHASSKGTYEASGMFSLLRVARSRQKSGDLPRWCPTGPLFDGNPGETHALATGYLSVGGRERFSARCTLNHPTILSGARSVSLTCSPTYSGSPRASPAAPESVYSLSALAASPAPA